MTSSNKPIVLQLGADIKWNHDLYRTFTEKFDIVRSHSMDRQAFISALKSNKFGNFSAIYRPFWHTGGEMGNWDDELISLLPSSCKIYASAGAGFDWVDTQRLAQSGILYCNAAAACTESVADAAIYLILSTFRQFSWSAMAARSCDAAQFKEANKDIAIVTRNPNNATLGIVGLGRIGYRIAQKASTAFEMKIAYNDIRRMPSQVEESIGAKFYPNLKEMLSEVDCVLVATPFGGDKVIDATAIAAMKPGSRLVNIARGKLVDEEALIDALENRHLYSAGLDVHFDEPNVNPRLAAMRNVEMLSHTAGASLDSHVGFEKLGMENIISYFDQGKALTAVNAHLIKPAKL